MDDLSLSCHTFPFFLSHTAPGIDCNPVHSYIVRSGTLRLTKKDDTEVCISTGERVNASDARFSSMTAETTVVCYLLKRQALEEFMYQGGRRASMVAGSAQVSAVPEVQLEDVEVSPAARRLSRCWRVVYC